MKQKPDPRCMFPSLIFLLDHQWAYADNRADAVDRLLIERWSSYKIIEGNVQGGSVFKP